MRQVMHKMIEKSPDGLHCAIFYDIGEIPWGPPYYNLCIDNQDMGSRILGRVGANSIAWSKDSSILAVQEWLTTDASLGPNTRVLFFDLRWCCVHVMSEDLDEVDLKEVIDKKKIFIVRKNSGFEILFIWLTTVLPVPLGLALAQRWVLSQILLGSFGSTAEPVISRRGEFEMIYCQNDGSYAQEKINDDTFIDALREYKNGDKIKDATGLSKVKTYLMQKGISTDMLGPACAALRTFSGFVDHFRFHGDSFSYQVHGKVLTVDPKAVLSSGLSH